MPLLCRQCRDRDISARQVQYSDNTFVICNLTIAHVWLGGGSGPPAGRFAAPAASAGGSRNDWCDVREWCSRRVLREDRRAVRAAARMTRTAVCESLAPTAPPITAPARQHPPRSQLAAADAARAWTLPLGTQPAVCTHQPSKTRPPEGGAASGGPQALCRSPLAPQDAHSAPVDHHRRRPRRGMSRPPHRYRLSPAAHRHDPGTVTTAQRGAPAGSLRARGLAAADAHPRTDRPGSQQTNAQPSRPNPIRSPRWRPGGGVGAAAGAGPSANPPRAAALRNSTRHPRNTPRQPRGSQPRPGAVQVRAGGPQQPPCEPPASPTEGPWRRAQTLWGPHPLSGALPTAAVGLRWRSGSVAASDRAPFTDRRDSPPASTRKSPATIF